MTEISHIISPVVNAGLKILGRTRKPQDTGKLVIPELNNRVEVFRDPYGVPHIYAQNTHDLMLAQGFVHAQERLWQMEFNRRLVAGRLSEIIGASTVQVDRWFRTLTMRRVAELEVGLLNDEIVGYLNSYAEGINQFIRRGRLPIEFSILRYKPEPWEIADTLAWIKMMAWGLSVNWEFELLRAKLVNLLGADGAAELEPPHLGRWPYIISPDMDYTKIGASPNEQVESIRPFSGPSQAEGVGSNNWVISGELTNTGMPLLANDMHLPMGIPSIWFENHIVCDQFDTIGVTFPGIPGVVSGHNGYVAWGLTNGFPDVQDLYIERIRRLDDGRVQAEYDGRWEDARVLHEVIQIKGGSTASEEVIITRHGPIISSILTNAEEADPLALRWTALEPDTMIEVIFSNLSAQDCVQFHHGLRHWKTPVQNVVYADTKGNIAYSFPGKIPIRAKGDGRLPVPGWTSEYEWVDYIAYENLPHFYNPPQGYIVTANNRVFDDKFPNQIFIEPISGDRSQRIVELIDEYIARNAKIGIDYFKQMQFDQQSPSAREIIRQFNKLDLDSADDEGIKGAIRAIRSWDGNLGPDSYEGVIYQAFIRQLIRTIISARLLRMTGNIHEELVMHYMGKGPNPVLAEIGQMGDLWLPWLTDILDKADRSWFDLGNGETQEDAFVLALGGAISDLNQLLGPNIKSWTWGRIHKLSYTHVLGENPVLGKFFNRGPFETGGNSTTVWATGSSYHDLNHTRFIGPPYRMIVDLGDLRNSCSILAPGQSGHPTSSHYDDQIMSWYNAEYHPMLYNREDIQQAATKLLILTPV